MTINPRTEADAYAQAMMDASKGTSDIQSREIINSAFRVSLLHFVTHKDIRVVTRQLATVPSPSLKRKMLHHLSRQLPFLVNEKQSGVLIDKTRVDYLTAPLVQRFNIMDCVLGERGSKGIMHIDCDTDVSVDEFVSWLSDTLTLRRREFSDDQVEYLVDILIRIKSKQTIHSIKEHT